MATMQKSSKKESVINKVEDVFRPHKKDDNTTTGTHVIDTGKVTTYPYSSGQQTYSSTGVPQTYQTTAGAPYYRTSGEAVSADTPITSTFETTPSPTHPHKAKVKVKTAVVAGGAPVRFEGGSNAAAEAMINADAAGIRLDEEAGTVVSRERFTKTEDHEIVIEKKTIEVEHRPVQKEYLVETRFLGEHSIPGAAMEFHGTEVRVVEERVRQAPIGNRTIVVENVDLPVEEVKVNIKEKIVLPAATTIAG